MLIYIYIYIYLLKNLSNNVTFARYQRTVKKNRLKYSINIRLIRFVV